MGLLIGIGSTKPQYSYDNYYGVEWDTLVSSPDPTRIGKDELHKSVPLQSKVVRCLLNDDGTVNYYLHATDSTKRDSGATADLSGASGMVMVELPDAYMRFEMSGTSRRCLMSEQKLPGFTLWKKDYVSAYEATVDRSINQLVSVCNDDAQYRGGNNSAAADDTYYSQLGKPATNISLTNFRTYARNGGRTTEWNCNLYKTHKKMWWFFVVEYCTFNSQKAFDAALTSEGFHQGGLGAGITNLTQNRWQNWSNNLYGSIVKCGVTNSLGNATGIIEQTMPFEYNGATDTSGDYGTHYVGVYDSSTAYTSGEYVSQGELLYQCIADAPAGTSLDDTAYFSAVTRTVISIPSYRGVENPFGDLYKWTDGVLFTIQADDAGGRSTAYVAKDDDPDNFSSTSLDDYVEICDVPRETGVYITEVALGEHGDIFPIAYGGSSTTYFCDCWYTSLPDSGESIRGLLLGGRAASGAAAGFVYLSSNYAPSATGANFGSRLCFYPKG